MFRSFLVALFLLPLVVSAGTLSQNSLPLPQERMLYAGLKGEDVREFQRALNETIATSSPLPISGYFGPITERTVQRFQEKEGIVHAGTPRESGYGAIGPKTRTALRLASLSSRCTWESKPTRQACLGDYYGAFAKTHGTLSALRLIEAHTLREAQFGFQCHEVMHRIGHEGADEYRTLGDAFMRGTDLCQNGYYHGVVEEYLRDQSVASVTPEELRGYCKNASRYASSTEPTLNCVHGLGHALVYMTHDKMPLALSRCLDLEKDDERGECAAGAFMQHSFAEALTGARVGASNDLSEPCQQVFFDGGQCWLSESARVIASMGKDKEGAKNFCNKLEPAHQPACTAAILDNVTSAGAR